ncbi:MAG: hypothetical protein KGL35_26925 [Bradyrhizobium sp.]|nr:hypothetical protein [Bradyrhizobium sp.]
MAAKARKKFSKKERSTVEGRFALHLRSLMDAKGWQVGDLQDRLAAAGLDVQKPAIHKWLRGDSMPLARDLETLGRVFSLEDPRHILPPLA